MNRRWPLLVVAFVLAAGCTSGPFADRVTRPGGAAKELIDTDLHPKLLVEIDHPPGYAPNAEARSILKSTLSEVSGRAADAVTIVEEASIPAQSGKKYSFGEIEALEHEHRDHHTGGDTAVLYVVYVAGGSTNDESDARVLGAAYRGTSLVMFKGNIQEASKGPTVVGPIGGSPFSVEERCIERSVLVHEFGHAAGLVNLGTPMVRPHEDTAADHRGHSSNKQSVMYYAVENTQDLFALFGGCADIPYRFDDDDKADLRALRDP